MKTSLYLETVARYRHFLFIYNDLEGPEGPLSYCRRYSEEGPGQGRSPPRPLLAAPNVAAHPSTASVPTSYDSMWHYNCLWSLKGSDWPAVNYTPCADRRKYRKNGKASLSISGPQRLPTAFRRDEDTLKPPENNNTV